MNEILRMLRDRDAPRVLTTAMIQKLLDQPRATVGRAIRKAIDLELLAPVRQGVFLNNMALPSPKPAEAAGFVRTGAVVSLQTVLGDSAVLNNPTPDVFCVLSMDAPGTDSGAVQSPGGPRFIFRRMAPGRFNAGSVADRYVAGLPYLRATPERALLDWIALGASPHSSTTPPPAHDIDIAMLDGDRMSRLADAMDLREDLERFVDASRASQSPVDDSYAIAGMGMGI